jgi:glycerophosphoryl diester phosphodiesterase
VSGRSITARVGSVAAVAAISLVAVVAVDGPAVAGDDHRRDGRKSPLVIAHRGASGYRPEHTLAAYELAIDLGADYVEPDLVLTKDGHLVARHDNVLGPTTDVADHPEFAGRRTTKSIDGVVVPDDWFSEDFTLAELKTLRAVERIPGTRPANAAYDGQFPVPTLTEVLELVHRKERATGRTIGVYPETKHPSYFAGVGLDMDAELVRVLDRHGYDKRSDAVFVQSFEVANLRRLDRLTDVRLVQLLNSSGQPWDVTAAGGTRTYADMATPAGLREIARYADGVGPEKYRYIIPKDATGNVVLANATSFVADAHRAHLEVHPWTFRAENTFLPTNYKRGTDPNALGDAVGEMRTFLATGIDGFFTDQPDVGVEAVAGMPSKHAVTVAVIGDTPYGAAQIPQFPNLVADINADPRVRTALHVGDIKNGSTRCDDSYFATIAGYFGGFADPLVYTPGDNEWTDCHRANNGAYLPTERLAALRQVFFPQPGATLGAAMDVDPQSRDRAHRAFVENVRWSTADVTFATAHVVGSNNGLAPWFSATGQPGETPAQTSERRAEVEARTNAAVAWIDGAFDAAERQHHRGVVLAMQADTYTFGGSGFAAISERIADRAAGFDGDVLVLQGDTHDFLVDHPVVEAPNLTRVVVEGETVSEWLALTVDPAGPRLFRWERIPA